MKKIILSLCIILPLFSFSCSKKIVDKNKPNKESNISETNNESKENNKIEEENSNNQESENKESLEKETETTQVISNKGSVDDSRFGYLESIYLNNDDYYLDLDEAELFFGPESITEAIKDNTTNMLYDDDGNPYMPNGYYIRNNYTTLSTFRLSKDSKFYICGYALDDDNLSTSTDLYEVSIEKFIKLTTQSNYSYEDIDNPGKFIEYTRKWPIWADIKDGEAIKIYQQFFP